MPKVGKKAFPYTKKGETAAADYSQQTGMPETMHPPKKPKKKSRGK